MSAKPEIESVLECADFQPAYNGEEFVTMTFRVPHETGVIPGVWKLCWDRPLAQRPKWSIGKDESP